MLTAIVHIRLTPELITQAAQQITEIHGVSNVYSVTGDVDVIAVVKVQNHEAFASVIPNGIAKIAGVLEKKTYLAFEEYSKNDIALAYDLGLEN